MNKATAERELRRFWVSTHALAHAVRSPVINSLMTILPCMTEQPNETSDVEVLDRRVLDPAAYHSPDWLLQLYVDLLEKTGVSFSVTLNVGGMLVSGELVSAEQYFDGITACMTESAPEDSRASVNAYFGGIAGIFKESLGDVTGPLPSYIHLKEARVFHHSGAPIPSNERVWWRGRITRVDGFWLGALAHSS